MANEVLLLQLLLLFCIVYLWIYVDQHTICWRRCGVGGNDVFILFSQVSTSGTASLTPLPHLLVYLQTFYYDYAPVLSIFVSAQGLLWLLFIIVLVLLKMAALAARDIKNQKYFLANVDILDNIWTTKSEYLLQEITSSAHFLYKKN